MTLQCPANLLHFLQSENIGSPDGDPITGENTVLSVSFCRYLTKKNGIIGFFLIENLFRPLPYRFRQRTVLEFGTVQSESLQSRLIHYHPTNNLTI